MLLKNKLLNIRVTEKERDDFNECCRANKLNPSDAIRSFMRCVVEKRIDLPAIVGASVPASGNQAAKGAKAFIDAFFPNCKQLTPVIFKAIPLFHFLSADIQKEIERLAAANAAAQ